MKGHQSIAPHGQLANFWLRANLWFCRFQKRRAEKMNLKVCVDFPSASIYWLDQAMWWEDRINDLVRVQKSLESGEQDEENRLMVLNNELGG
jgi:hypothetical protein